MFVAAGLLFYSLTSDDETSCYYHGAVLTENCIKQTTRSSNQINSQTEDISHTPHPGSIMEIIFVTSQLFNDAPPSV